MCRVNLEQVAAMRTVGASWRVRDSLCISASGPVSAQYLPPDTQLAKRLHEYKVLL